MTRSIYSPRHVLFGALAAFLGLASADPGAAQTSQAAGAPDLTPNIEAILQGAVSIRNLGAAPAGASLATVRCVGLGDNPCAQSPLMTRFTNPNIPDVISVVIPPLGPGDAYDYKLPYWNALVWSAGEYSLTVRADASGSIAETNEGNNLQSAVMTKP